MEAIQEDEIREDYGRRCLHSKPALLIFLWTFTVSLVYNFGVNPEIYFVLFPYRLIICCYLVYGLLVFLWPLGGHYGDMNGCRFKMVKTGLYMLLLPPFGYIFFYPNALPLALDFIGSSYSNLFIHWYVWAYYASMLVSRFAWNAFMGTIYFSYGSYYSGVGFFLFMLVVVAILILIIISVCLMKCSKAWFISNASRDSRGKFTAILNVIVSLGLVFALDLPTNSLLPVLYKQHALLSENNIPNRTALDYFRIVLINRGSLMPLVIVICIPLYLVVRPTISWFLPSALRTIALGIVIRLISIVCILIAISKYHLRDNIIEKSCMFAIDYDYYENVIPFSVWLLSLPLLLSALSHMLIYISLFEFICSESTNAFRGLLIGMAYAIDGAFKLEAAIFAIPFFFWKYSFSISCEFGYYVMNLVLGVVALNVYLYTAWRYCYKYRERGGNNYAEDRALLAP